MFYLFIYFGFNICFRNSINLVILIPRSKINWTFITLMSQRVQISLILIHTFQDYTCTLNFQVLIKYQATYPVANKRIFII